MRKTCLVLLAWVLVAAFAPSDLSGAADPAGGDGVVVLVNAHNEISLDEDETKRLLRRLYLKERSSWPDGERAVFFARASADVAERRFRREILDMTDASLDDHWIRQKQTRGETPPRAVRSTRILMRQIERRPNAVGVVTKSEFDELSGTHENVRILISLHGDAR
ncbi:MAG: hypothetical protein ACFB00_11910 [Parvularculaceae bacterium]